MKPSSNLYILISLFYIFTINTSQAQSLAGQTYISDYSMGCEGPNYHTIHHMCFNFKEDYVNIFYFSTGYSYGETKEEKWNFINMEIPDDLVRKYRYTYINDTLRIIDELVKPKKVHPNLYTPEFIPSFDLSFFLLMSHIEVSDKVSEPLYVANDSIKPERQNYMLFHKAPNITLHDGKQYISSPIKVILPNRKNYKYKVLGRFVNNEFLLDSICIKEKFRKKYSQEIDDALSQVKKRKFSFIEKNNYLMIEYLYTKGVLKIKKKKLVGRDISFYQL